jgi:hypothetical protein
MGQPGDLLLIFADALIRSWKQITKYKSATSPTATTEIPRSASEGGGAGEGYSGIGGFMASGASPLVASAASAGETTQGATAGARKPPTLPPAGKQPVKRPSPVTPHAEEGTSAHEAGELTEQLMPGVIRDERGVWIAPETED